MRRAQTSATKRAQTSATELTQEPHRAVRAISATRVVVDGRELRSFAGCNYLGLAHDERVIAAWIDGAREHGISTAASRRTSGNDPAHDELERDLARFLRVEAALLAPDGYMANLALAQALAREHELAFVDEHSHPSVRDALAAAGVRTIEYAHVDAASARRALAAHPCERPLIFTDGVFPARRTAAPVAELVGLLPRGRGILAIDDAHGFGVLGAHGRGLCEHVGVDDARIVTTTTLAKAFGCHGGVIAGARAHIDAIEQRANAYVCSTPIPPALARAASAALHELEAHPARLARLRANVERVRGAFEALGLSAPVLPIPVFAIKLDTHERMERVQRRLEDAGFFVPLIDYPDGLGAHLRLTVCAEHASVDVDALVRALRRELA